MLSTMMVPFPVTMVSLFVMFRWLGEHTGMPWLGTFKPLWVPAWFASAFNIFLLRQFFLTIPNELSEAARIDGCSEFGIFYRIVLPLARPALSVVALFSFMGTWNDYLGPLIYLQRPEQFTLALGLQNFQSQQGGTPWHLLMAASLLIILPVLALFFLAQRTFIEGIATTGTKG
jgi:multiple sugar transport system permease protein